MENVMLFVKMTGLMFSHDIKQAQTPIEPTSIAAFTLSDLHKQRNQRSELQDHALQKINALFSGFGLSYARL